MIMHREPRVLHTITYTNITLRERVQPLISGHCSIESGDALSINRHMAVTIIPQEIDASDL